MVIGPKRIPIVAQAMLGHLHEAYEPNKYYGNITVVPDYRQRGIGTALYDFLLARFNELNGTRLIAGTQEDQTEGVRFLMQRGFQVVLREPISTLRPESVELGQFQATIDRIAANGITIISMHELAMMHPEWQRELYELNNAVEIDIPRSEAFTPEPFDIWCKSLDSEYERYAECSFVALDGEQPVGMSVLFHNRATDAVISTGITGVLRAYRRRGLATTLKLRAIRFALDNPNENGDIPTIRTGNEESNPMLALNKRLGFVEESAYVTFAKSFADDVK